jgi:hypothetical protein
MKAEELAADQKGSCCNIAIALRTLGQQNRGEPSLGVQKYGHLRAAFALDNVRRVSRDFLPRKAMWGFKNEHPGSVRDSGQEFACCLMPLTVSQ